MPADLNPVTTPSVRALLRTAWPLVVHGLVTVAVAGNDVLLLGRESPRVLASAVAATSVLTVLVLTTGAWGIGAQIEAARARGAGDRAGAWAAAGAALRVAALGAAPVWLVAMVAAPSLTAVLAGDTVDADLAGRYLRIVLLGLPCTVVSAGTRAGLSAAGRTAPVLVAGLCTAGADVAASLVLREVVGPTGVAWGTVTGFATGAAVLLAVAWRRSDPGVRRLVLHPPVAAVRQVFRVGWPEVLLALFSSASGIVVVVVLAGSPSAVLAAGRLLDVQVQVGWVVLSGLGQALLTLLAAGWAAGRAEVTRRWLRTGAVVLGVTAAVLAVGGGLLTRSAIELAGGPELVAVVGSLGWLAWAQIWWQAACVLGSTVCRAARDTRAPLLASLVGEYAVFLPVGLVLCRVAGAGLPGVLVAHHLFWATFVAVVAVRARRALRDQAGSSSSRPSTTVMPTPKTAAVAGEASTSAAAPTCTTRPPSSTATSSQ